MRRSMNVACSEVLESRQLMSVAVVTANYADTASVTGSSTQDFGPFTSTNGRFVAFDSKGTNVTSVGGAAQEVYVRDRLTGISRLVSMDVNNQPTAEDSWVADMSPDGRYVLFFTASDIQSTNVQGGRVTTDTDGQIDLYLRDTQTSQTFLISGKSVPGGVNATGGTLPSQFVAVGVVSNGTAPTLPAFVSDDGRYVSYASTADNIPDQSDESANPATAHDTNGSMDLFERDRTQNVTLLVSEGQTANTSPTGTQVGVIDSFAMSADGGHIAFSTTAQQVGSDTNTASDAYYRSVLTGTTSDMGSGTSNITISEDGTTSAFEHFGGFPFHIDYSVNGAPGSPIALTANSHSFGTPALSADGQYVFFRSTETDLIDAGTNGANVFRYNMQTGVLEVASLNSTGGTINLIGNAAAGRLSVSADGRYVAYQSDGTGSDPLISNYGAAAQTNVYVRDMNDTQVSLLNTQAADAAQAGSGNAWQPVISPDGKVVIFVSNAENLVTNDANGAVDVFSADVPAFIEPAFVARLSASDVSQGGATSYTFQVTYSGPRPIVLSTIDSNDIIVANLNPQDIFSQFDSTYQTFTAKLISVNSQVNSTVLTATYQIVPPGGSWDIADNGIYYVQLQNRQISDVQGAQLLQQNIGTFQVNIAAATPVGPTFTANVSEGAGTYTLTVQRSASDVGNVTGDITYQVFSGTAKLGVDFTVAGPDLATIHNIAPNGSFNIVFNIIDDSTVEGNETFSVVLSNETPGVTTTFQQAVITIVDNDSSGSGTVVVPPNSPIGSSPGSVPGSTISINNGVSTIAAPETSGGVTIPVSRAGLGTTAYAATFTYTVYSTPSDTAVAGVNFVSASGTLTFAPGSDTPTSPLVVQLLHDNQVTGDRTFTVVLTNDTTGLNISGQSLQVVEKDVDSAVQFGSIPLSVTDDDGVIDVPVTRVGNLTPGSTVKVAFGGTAVLGQDYMLVGDTVDESSGDADVTFAPGESTEIVHVKLISQSALDLGTVKNLTMSLVSPAAVNSSGDGVTYATVVGAPSVETVAINNVDATAPQVAGLNFTVKNGKIATVTVKFDEDVVGGSARNLKNYTLFERTNAGKLGAIVQLKAGKYDSSTDTVTLTPAQPLAANAVYQLNIAGKGTITDLAGNRLDGDANGTPTGSFVGYFGYGKTLTYTDVDNDLVTFTLKGPGQLKLTSLQNAITLDVLSPQDEASTLVGSIKKAKGGNGKAVLALLRLRGATFNPGNKFSGDIRAEM
ncbi:MAG TPA: Calx-beta domain-containing protein [Tepidisphaeraceae bacterium]|nr:Calx-beta domain-containing protein [Tepidisphaeraceae bacterium]